MGRNAVRGPGCHARCGVERDAQHLVPLEQPRHVQYLALDFLAPYRVGRCVALPRFDAGHHAGRDLLPRRGARQDAAALRDHAREREDRHLGQPTDPAREDTAWTRIDGALWGVYTVYRYLAETGDYTLLDEVVPYYDAGEGTVLDHLLRGMRFIGEHDGGDGLPLIFDVDWNDMLTLFSSTYRDVQSVMVAEQFIYAARLLLEILQTVGSPTATAWFHEKIRHYTQVLNSDACWDGAWFKRLLMHEMVMGSRHNREGQIFLNARSWAVIAGTLDAEKTRQAMDSAHRHLATEYGLRLFAPPFTKMLDNRTPFNSNTPGAGENGGIFLHANTWAVMASALLGNSERAWAYYRAILPPALAKDPDRYGNEPYAFSSWVYGPDHEQFGRGQLAWLTGGASWMHTVGWEYILGIRPTLNGMVLSPCAPREWQRYRVCRRIRGCRYEIEVRNPQGRPPESGISITAGGKALSDNVLPYSSENVCRVTVAIGGPEEKKVGP